MHPWDDILALHGGVLLRRELPDLSDALSRAARRGILTSILPGTFVDARLAENRDVRIAAAVRRYPAAVICHTTAAQLTFWPQLSSPTVHLASVQVRAATPGFTFHRRRIPTEWRTAITGSWLTAPALTAIDLAPVTDGESIDHALRTGSATLAELRSALDATHTRTGNNARRQLLLDSRAGPWSAAERLTHRLFRRAGITGWTANLEILCRGRMRYLDIGFPQLRVVVEVDGRRFHDDSAAFENDRYRQNELVLDGWLVLRFTWDMLTNHAAQVIELVQEALQLRSAGKCTPVGHALAGHALAGRTAR